MKKLVFKNSLIIALTSAMFAACNPSGGDSNAEGNGSTDSTKVASSINVDPNQTDKTAYDFIKGQEGFSYFNRLVELSPEIQKILTKKNPIYVLIPSDEFINTSEESYKARFMGKDEEDVATAMLKPYIFAIGNRDENGGLPLISFSDTTTVVFDKKNRTINGIQINSDIIKTSNAIVLESPIICE